MIRRLGLAAFALLAAAPAPAANILVNHAASGLVADGFHDSATMSANGRYVVWSGRSSTLDPSARPSTDDIWMRDTQTDALTRLSVSTLGALADSSSDVPQVSGDGRRVLFSSSATNLIDGQTIVSGGIYLRDLDAGTTAFVLPGWAAGSRMAGGGHHLVFASVAGNPGTFPGPVGGSYTAYRYDIDAAQYQVICPTVGNVLPNGNCHPISMSADGRFVLLYSYADNLAGDVTVFGPGVWLWVFDSTAGTLKLASRETAGLAVGAWQGAMSDDGRYVAFVANAGVMLRDLQAGTTILLDSASNTQFDRPLVSADGQRIAWHRRDVGGNSGLEGLWMLDRPTGIKFRVLPSQISVDEVSMSKDASTVMHGPDSDIRIIRPYTVSLSTTIAASAASAAIGSEFDVTYTLTNLGSETLEDVGIAISVDGDVIEPVTWDGAAFGATFGACGFGGFGDGECIADTIAPGQTRTLVVTYRGEQTGTAVFHVTLSSGVNDLQTADHVHATSVAIGDAGGGGSTGLPLVSALLALAALRRRRELRGA